MKDEVSLIIAVVPHAQAILLVVSTFWIKMYFETLEALMIAVEEVPRELVPKFDVMLVFEGKAVTEPPVACIGVPSVVLIVVRPAAVAAPVGRGKDEADTG